MKKYFFLLLIIGIFLAPSISYANEESVYNETTTTLLDSLYSDIDLYKLDMYMNSSPFYEVFGYMSVKDFILDVLNGDYNLDINNIFTYLKDSFFLSFRENIFLISSILILSILASVTNTLNASFMSKEISKVTFFAIYLALSATILRTFFNIIETSTTLISTVVTFMNGMLPIIIILLSLSGGILTSSIISPFLILIINTFSSVMNYFVIPSAITAFIISSIDNMMEDIDISYLTKFIKQIIMITIGLFSVLFLGLLGLKGSIFSSIDGVGFSTLKFAISSAIPIVGNLLSQSASSVMGFVVIIKNCVGLIGTLTLVFLVSAPLIEMATLIICFKISSIIAQPISDKRISSYLNETSSFLTLVFASLLVCVLMFILLIGIVGLLGNYTAMYR